MNEALRQVMSIQLAEQLFPDNAFYRRATRDGGVNGIAIDAEKVVIPQIGQIPNSQVDPTEFPLPVSRRVDLAQEYQTHLFATEPTIITNDEEILTDYDKRTSVVNAHGQRLNTDIADYIAWAWADTAGKTFLTTGTTARAATAPGATGNRKRVAKEDIMAIAEWFDSMNVLPENRYAVLPADMYYDLLLIDEFISYDKRGLTDLVAMGIIGELYGFQIMKRSRVVFYDMTNPATPVLRPVGSAGGINDSHAAIFWQQSTARYAYGEPQVFINLNQGNVLGSTVNAAVRSGGRASYTDGTGVAVLIQDIA